MLLALGVKWGCLGASELTALPCASSAKNEVSASPPKPLAHRASISRRVIGD